MHVSAHTDPGRKSPVLCLEGGVNKCSKNSILKLREKISVGNSYFLGDNLSVCWGGMLFGLIGGRECVRGTGRRYCI